ncbi:MAG: Gfo/Idh/MocA family oxidoreductase [Bacteroidetes bacterium]|nr:Gfo/Idh/MocA family oxidoreductase [Bacteroidota bacterium]
MSKIKFGIIGLGGISQLIHLPDLFRNKEVEITAIADINKNALLEVASKFKVNHAFTDYHKMLEQVEIDAVIIATPTKSHMQIALDCLNAGKHILVEKPLARTIEEAQKIADTAKEKGLIAMVGMNMRYRPDIMLLKGIINSGELGDPFFVKCSWFKSQSSSAKWFTKKDESGGGVIFDLGIVLLDVALWFLNFPEILSVSTHNFFINTKNVEDSSVSMIRAKSNSMIYLESSWAIASQKNTFDLEIYCTKGNALINPLRIIKNIDGQDVELKPMLNDNRKAHLEKSYQNELNHFIGAIKGLNPVLSSAEDSVARLKIIQNMYLSASTRKEVLV